jgi:hypothetical protein
VRKIMRRALSSAVLLTVLATPGGVLAEGQATGGGAGCQANGQAVASAGQTARPFGANVVKNNTPIADDVALFKARVCNPPA